MKLLQTTDPTIPLPTKKIEALLNAINAANKAMKAYHFASGNGDVPHHFTLVEPEFDPCRASLKRIFGDLPAKQFGGHLVEIRG